MVAALDARELQTIQALTALERTNFLQPTRFLSGLSAGVVGMHSPTVTHRNQVHSFLAECDALRQTLESLSRIVSPAILRRNDLEEVRMAALAAVREAVDESLRDIRVTWEAIVDQVSSSGSPTQFIAIPENMRDSATNWLKEFDSFESSPRLIEVLSKLKNLQSRIVEFESSLTPDFVLRTDLASIEFRISEAQSAGLMSRGRKMSALREDLGPQIVTSDNQLMVHAASQMISLAREVRGAIDELRELAPRLPLENFRPWVRDDIDGVAAQVQNLFVAEAVRMGFLEGWRGIDSDYPAALRLAIAVAPLIEEVRSGCGAILPDSDVARLRPWRAEDFEIFREEFSNSKAQSLLDILGTDAISRDPIAVVDATSQILNVETRFVAMESTFSELVFPGATVTFNVWDAVDFEQLTEACGDLLGVLDAVTLEAAVDLARLFDTARQPRLADLLADFACAKDDLEDYISVPSDRRSGGVEEMDLAEWVSVAPKLLDDAGPNNSFLQFHRLQSLRAAEVKIIDLGLEDSLPLLLNQEVDPQQFLLIVRRSVFTKLLRMQMEAANLDRFDHSVQARHIEKYSRSLDEARELLKERIPDLVVKRSQGRALPSGKQPGAVGSLLRGLKPKRGDKTPIRDLAADFGNELADALPCFLMSPDSVAALLPVGAIDFDLVVFDEASQIRTAHAVGAQ
jgi:hypothetical protein